MITDFPKKKYYNLAGLRSFQFVHVSEVFQYPIFRDGKAFGDLQLIGDLQLKAGYATYETLEFAENPVNSPNGVYYEQEITGFAPGDAAEMLDVISNMEDNEFVVLITDARGQRRIVGGYGYPLIFLSDFTTGARRVDRKGFSFTFSAVAPFRAPIIQT